MSLTLLNGVIADTPTRLDDKVRVSVPDLKTAARFTYGPLTFRPVVSGTGGVRLPQAGDRAVIGLDDSTDYSWIISWHRDDTTAPPYPT
jgi:hypothetical protein